MPLTIISTTQPAPLMSTNRTWHVITTWYFLYYRTAFFASLYGWWILPLFYFILKYWITTFSTMCFTLAWRTDLELTFGARECFLLLSNRDDNSAFWIGAPHEIRVFLNLQVLHEFQVLNEDIFWCELLNVILIELNATMRTRYWLYFHIRDFIINITIHARKTNRVKRSCEICDLMFWILYAT